MSSNRDLTSDDPSPGGSVGSAKSHQAPSLETETLALPPELPFLSNRYQLERQLGRGGFGVVYLALDRQLHSKHVVVKILITSFDDEKWRRKKFEQEIEALARINHPNVVLVTDTGETADGRPYLVMEYIEGVTLRSILKARRMEFAEIADVARQVASALTAAHDAGVFHRDLKPANIMLQALDQSEQCAKLIDFGIARLTRPEDLFESSANILAGTVPYMAPEQLNGKPCPASDIYSLGVIVYEMVTGRRPFEAETPIQLYAMQQVGAFEKPVDLRPGFPPKAQHTILKALAFSPEERHKRARDFGNELAAALWTTGPIKDREPYLGSSSQAVVPPEYWTTHSPFRSLQVFGPEDSWLFFGRDLDTDELLTRLGRAPTLAVIGNSGSGKSSLIQAGLIPALRRGRFRYGGKSIDSWRIAVFRPSTSPFDYLAETLPGQLAPDLSPKDHAEFVDYCKQKLPEGGEALRNAIAALAGAKGQTTPCAHVLLAADQFEELFTLVEDKAIRGRYIDSLLAAADLDAAIPVHLVLSLRADFYGHCLEHPQLSECIATNLYNVRRMSAPQLREAIENRLALAAGHAEAGLIDSLLTDVGEEPGNLALLEHALSQLWDKCGGSGRTLTSNAYAGIGRLRGALGKHADEVYRAIGSEADQRLVQRIFLELVQLGEGAQDTRRRVPKEALFQLGEPKEVERLIANLASNRLVATSGQGPQSPDENFVEVSHEALIREWPALQEWLKDNREDLRLGRLLLQAAEEWCGLKKDPSALLHGVRLGQGQEWLDRQQDAPALVREFLSASLDAKAAAERREQEAQELEVARQRELRQAAEARAEAEELLRQESDRRRVAARLSAYTLGALFLIAAGVAWFAHEQQLKAQSSALAAQAEQMLVRDRPAALQMAMRSWRIDKTAEAHLAVADTFPQLMAKLEGHLGYVMHAEFSPDGQRIVTASLDKTARVWNATNGQLLVKLEGHTIEHAAFSPDGQRIVTASGTRAVGMDRDGQPVATRWPHGCRGTRPSRPTASASSPPVGTRRRGCGTRPTANCWPSSKATRTVSGTRRSRPTASASSPPAGTRRRGCGMRPMANCWSNSKAMQTPSLTRRFRPTASASSRPAGTRRRECGTRPTANCWPSSKATRTVSWHAAFSPDGQRIVTASEDKTARVWNAANGQLLAKLEGHTDSVVQAAFSPDGQRIVTASEDKTARVWNAANGQLLAKLEGHTGLVHQAAFSPDGQRIVTASADHTARVWNAANGQLLAKLEGHTGAVSHAAFSPDGQRIVTASQDKTARVWNAASGQLLAKLEGHTNTVEHAAFSPDGQRIVTASGDKTARVWNAANGQLLATFEGHTNALTHVAFSPDGRRIVTASNDRTARVWNAANGQLLAKLEGHTGGVRHAEFSPDGQRIVTASGDKTARVWNAANGQLLVKLEGHTNALTRAAFSPDGQRILTASEDNTARVWNAAHGQLSVKLEGHLDSVSYAAFSPDGQRIVTAGDETARIWNADNGQLVAKLEGHTKPVEHASFSPDGQRIVTASGDMTARVWNAINGQLLAKLEGHTGGVRYAEFSPDGQRIVTASNDTTARVWNADNGQLLANLEGHVNYVLHASFSPDGQRILTGGMDHVARIYRLVTLSDIAELLRK